MTNGKLLLCVPSRGRPLKMAEFLDSFAQHHTPGLSEVVLRNGSHDPSLEAYVSYPDKYADVIRYVGDDDTFAARSMTGNAGYCLAQQDIYETFPDYDAYLTIEDDTILHTTGFDRMLLDRIAAMPNRVGMIQLHDIIQTIEVQCFSAEWCRALGYLCEPEVGETAFILSRLLAQETGLFQYAADIQFRHWPLLRQYGYSGNERPGAVSQPDIVRRFQEQTAHLNRWLPSNALRLRAKLLEAAHGKADPDSTGA